MPAITFYNPGEIDPRLISTLGVNVKDSSSAIGFFGTGLKYAIAVLLREGQEIVIFSGLSRITFRKQEEILRGKSFFLIHMSVDGKEQPLGFTTELGKNWNLRHAYRELYCNAKDEGGAVTENDVAIFPGETSIVIRGEEFLQVHLSRDEFILNPALRPFAENEQVQAFKIPSSALFYKGIAAMQLAPSALCRYNVKDSLSLTEDRTILYPYFANSRVASFITEKVEDPLLLQSILTQPCYEHNLDLADYTCVWSEAFSSAVKLAISTFPTQVDERVKKRYFDVKPKQEVLHEEVPLTPAQAAILTEAKTLLFNSNYPITNYRTIPVEHLGDGILGLASRPEGTIYLALEAFSRGVPFLAEVLLEEFFHLNQGVADESREFQNLLLKELIAALKKIELLMMDISTEKKTAG